MVNQSLSESMQSLTHTGCSSVFLPKKPEPTHFFKVMQSFNSSSLYQFLLRGQLFLWSIFETFFSWSPQVWTQKLLHGYFCLTCFKHTHRPTSHKANELFHATQCAACEDRVMKLRKPIFACHNLAPWNACMRVTLDHIEKVRIQANSGQTESE